MNPARRSYYRWLFGIAAIYDLVLGVIFLFFGRWAFEALDIEEKYPEGGFLPLIGAFVLVLGLAYAFIWRGDFWRNRDLIAVGALYKLAYTGVGLWIAIFDEVLHWLFLWAFGVADAVMFVLILECWLYIHAHKGAERMGSRSATPTKAATAN